MTALGNIENTTAVMIESELDTALEDVGGAGGEVVLDMMREDSGLTVTTYNASAPQTFITADAITLDGSTDVCVEFSCPALQVYTAGGNFEASISVWLYDGSTKIRGIAYMSCQNNGSRWSGLTEPIYVKFFLEAPSAGTHTYSVRANKDGENSGSHPSINFTAGDDATGGWEQSYLRVTAVSI